MNRLMGIIVIITVIALLPSIAGAQYISVRQSTWGTLQYTKDGINFTEFGSGWRNLLDETESVDAARGNILASRNLHYAGIVFGIGGGFALGYAASLESQNKEVDGTYWIMGASFTLSSLICELVSRHELYKGLLTYNDTLYGYSPHKRQGGGLGLGFTGNSVSILYNF